MKRAFLSAYLTIFGVFLCAFIFPPPAGSANLTNNALSDQKKLAPAPSVFSIPSPSGTVISARIGEETLEIGLEELLVGVVAAEMSALYPPDALMAQAVAARSYILYRADISSSAHPDAQVCTDPSHCFAWCGEQQLRDKWGKDYDLFLRKVTDAVDSTRGEYMSCDDNPINAVFHAISGGLTESACDVWSADIPYLTAVSSNGDETSPSYLSRVSIDASDFKEAVLEHHPEALLPDDLSKCFESITRSASGGVTSVSFGNLRLHGSEVRAIAGLRSNNFTVSYSDGLLIFEVRGYGHGVGMSQYGAKTMAESGGGYREILAHYYTGVEFATLDDSL